MAKPAAPTRASGRTPADEQAANELKSLDGPVELDGNPIEGGLTGGAVSRPEDVHQSLTPAFSRMRTDWNSPDRPIIDQMKHAADAIIQKGFGEYYDLLYAIYDLVREKDIDLTTGEIKTDVFGLPIWKRAPGTHNYIEDWTRLGYREREQFLFQITTSVFRWTQLAADMWAEAMFARAQFEEAFAHGYEDLKNDKATIDDRTARARKLSAEYRYHAVYTSYLSRKADAVVRSAELLGQRLKDLMAQ